MDRWKNGLYIHTYIHREIVRERETERQTETERMIRRNKECGREGESVLLVN